MLIIKIKTGFANLDKALEGGLKCGQVYVIEGKAEIGKSALVQNIALHASIGNNVGTTYYANKDGRLDVLHRMAQIKSGCYPFDCFEKNEWCNAYETVKKIDSAPLLVMNGNIDKVKKHWRGIFSTVSMMKSKLLIIDDLNSLVWECKRCYPILRISKIRDSILSDMARFAKTRNIAIVIVNSNNINECNSFKRIVNQIIRLDNISTKENFHHIYLSKKKDSIHDKYALHMNVDFTRHIRLVPIPHFRFGCIISD